MQERHGNSLPGPGRSGHRGTPEADDARTVELMLDAIARTPPEALDLDNVEFVLERARIHCLRSDVFERKFLHVLAIMYGVRMRRRMAERASGASAA